MSNKNSIEVKKEVMQKIIPDTTHVAILKKNASFEIIEKGEDLLKNNDFFKDLSEIMEDPKFNNFFKKYFKDMSEAKVSLVYMKLYDVFKEKWKQMTDEELDQRINVFLLWKMMRSKDLNRFALHTVLDHFESPKKTDIFNELKQFIEFTDKKLILKD